MCLKVAFLSLSLSFVESSTTTTLLSAFVECSKDFAASDAADGDGNACSTVGQLLLEGLSMVTELESGLAGDLLLDTSAAMFFVGLGAGRSLSMPFEAVLVLSLRLLEFSLLVALALLSAGGGDGEAVEDTLGLAASRLGVCRDELSASFLASLLVSELGSWLSSVDVLFSRFAVLLLVLRGENRLSVSVTGEYLVWTDNCCADSVESRGSLL